ncbi:MAG: ADP-ribose diphosphatase [Alteromonadaceae bacterium]|nr:MAG: ADP-ribose diphosphatase [Alteromonadaceae bacterium]
MIDKLLGKFSLKDVDIIERDTVFQGFTRLTKLLLRHRLFSGAWGQTIEREVFVRGDACAAILYDPKSDVIGFIEQFRIGTLESEFGPWCLEVVAGMVEEGESPEQVITRELKEEAGIDSAELIHITSYYSTPGACSEKIHLFCAVCDLENREGVFGLEEENEDILLHSYPSEEVFAVMFNSRLNNAATLIGLQWLQLHRSNLREVQS